jgi:2-amino-4-hydroxy-6-hydroxymethyldihydropteridine diphosphokinase
MPPHPARAFVALGSNLADRPAHLRAALDAMHRLPGTRVQRLSDFIETTPVSPIPQPLFLNAAAELSTTLPPRRLLQSLLSIERARGRVRAPGRRHAPRTLDLDLLLYADLVIDEPGLLVPHPAIAQRLFVLRPLAQIAPDVVVPTLARTVSDLLATLERAPPATAQPA